MKFQLKFVQRNNCFISLPRSFASVLSQSYDSRSIASIIRLKPPESPTIYLSYNGLISEKDSEIEISHIFASINGLIDGDFVEIYHENQINSIGKFELSCEINDYEVLSINFFINSSYFL